jgi:predicted XRE-type DNA-binding protein
MKNKIDELIIDERELDKRIERGEIDPVHIPRFVTFSEIEKYQFCTVIIKYAKANSLKQKDMAEIIDVNKSEISKLFAYNLREFSQERILGFIQTLLKNGAAIDLDAAYDDIKIRSAKLQKEFAANGQLVVGA